MLYNTFILKSFIIFCFFYLSCGLEPTLSGGEGSGSGVGNPAVSCAVFFEDSTVAAHATVRLRPSSYIDSAKLVKRLRKIHDTLTDSTGTLSLFDLDSGEYTVEIVSGDSVGTVTRFYYNGTENIELPHDTLHAMAQISGAITLGIQTAEQTSIHIPGLERHISIDDSGYFSVLVPEGVYEIRVHSGGKETIILDSIRTQRGQASAPVQAVVDSTYLPCDSWECDTNVVRNILDENGLFSLTVDSVIHNEYGIGNRVYGLRFSNRGITRLPKITARLKTLRELYLRHNDLIALPEIISTLDSLHEIKFSYNLMQSLPSWLGTLPRLTEIDAESNQINEIPATLLANTNISECSFALNYLCNQPQETILWLNKVDPDWALTQQGCN